jgi:hypothetical protein
MAQKIREPVLHRSDQGEQLLLIGENMESLPFEGFAEEGNWLLVLH